MESLSFILSLTIIGFFSENYINYDSKKESKIFCNRRQRVSKKTDSDSTLISESRRNLTLESFLNLDPWLHLIPEPKFHWPEFWHSDSSVKRCCSYLGIISTSTPNTYDLTPELDRSWNYFEMISTQDSYSEHSTPESSEELRYNSGAILEPWLLTPIWLQSQNFTDLNFETPTSESWFY